MNSATNMVEFITDENWSNSKELEDEIHLASAKLIDYSLEVEDPLEEVNLGTTSDPRRTVISGILDQFVKDNLISFL